MADAAAPPESQDPPSDVGFGRVVSFSDGVFAIAITLLVLSIDIPRFPTNVAQEEVPDAIGRLGPDLWSYFIGFAVIGLFWIEHHRLFNDLRRFDERLLYANLFYLAFIALLPFPTGVFGDYSNVSEAVMLYAGSVALAGLMGSLMLWLAYSRDLVRPELRPHRNDALLQSLIAPGVFLLSIPLAALDPESAPYLWLALLVAPFLTHRWRARRGLRRRGLQL